MNILKAAGTLLVLVVNTTHAADTVTVFAAASLANALSEVSATYQQKTGAKVIHSFASSATLAKQIEAGAPADVYLSANSEWMDYLQDRKLIAASSRRNLLSNRLVLVVSNGKALPVKFDQRYNFARAFDGRLCMGNVDTVPAGKYAKQSLEYLKWWPGIRHRIVESQDVRAALAFVEREECRAGIVYESDARISNKVAIAGTFPESTHAPIVYPAALVGGKNKGIDYLAYLQSPASRAIFIKHGFRPIP
ncbi:MAG TPA: molybdate ABC transporter substrate-binding protein [Methylophilaceae bacterium]|nr:molybdate ABC transporter substrate-binding protein [Methylophilaceae bacterium]